MSTTFKVVFGVFAVNAILIVAFVIAWQVREVRWLLREIKRFIKS